MIAVKKIIARLVAIILKPKCIDFRAERLADRLKLKHVRQSTSYVKVVRGARIETIATEEPFLCPKCNIPTHVYEERENEVRKGKPPRTFEMCVRCKIEVRPANLIRLVSKPKNHDRHLRLVRRTE